MKLPPRTHQIAVASFALLVLAVGGYYYVYSSFDAMRTERINAQHDRDQREARARSADDARRLVESTHRMREELAAYLVSTEDPIAFLTTLESLGRATGVELEVDSLSVENGTGTNDKTDSTESQIRVVALVRGTWEAVYQFTALVERMPYAVTVAKVAFEQDNKTARQWKGQVHLHASAE